MGQMSANEYSRRKFLSQLGITVVSVGAAPTLLSACSSDSPDATSSGSTATGAVNLLTWEGYDLPLPAMDSWLKANDITVNSTFIGNHDEIQAKIKGGGNSAGYDLTTYYQGYKRLYAELEILTPLDEGAIPNIEGMIPFFAGDEKNYWVDPDGTRTGVPFTWAFLGLTYNTAAVDKLTNWSDLLDPKFKGKIVTIDDPAGQFALGCEINGLDPASCPKDKMQTVADGIAPYIAQTNGVSASFGDMTAQMVSGDAVAAYLGWTAMNSFAAAKGLNTVTTIIPSEGSYSSCDALAIPPTTKNPDAALAWINQALDPKLQAQSAEYLVAGVVMEDAIPLLKPDVKAIYPYDDINGLFEQAPLFGNAPLESDEFVTTAEWADAWQLLKLGE